MRRIILTTLAALGIAVSIAACGDAGGEVPAPAGPHKLSKAELIARVRPAIAKVFVETPIGKFSGSAVTFDAEKGLLITNGHVIDGASSVEVRFSGSKDRISAHVVGRSLCPDLAVLELEDVPDDLQALSFADSSQVEIGDTVAVVGFEGNVRRWGQAKARVAFGTVGDKDIRNADLGPEIGPQGRLVLTDAAVNPGSSGGAIVTEDGEVAAITTLEGGGDDQGYGIQADVVREALPDLKAGESGTGLQTRPVRSVPVATVLSVLYGDEGLTPSAARALARYVYKMGGMFVLGAGPGSPADRRGFEFGDVVWQMNGLTVNDQTKHCRVLGSSSVVKMKGYHLARGWDALFEGFTRRVAVK
jgi:S1-C subfamily serine protease